MTTPPDYDCSSVASSSTATLPLYTPSDASPSYAPEPSVDEQRLDYVARKHEPRAPSGTLTKKLRDITVTLSGQEDGASVPKYTRNSYVRGELQLDHPENVHSITMKLEGRQSVTVAEGGTSDRALFLRVCKVWKRGSSPTCPTILPFSIPFPLNYMDKGKSIAVPPSFSTEFSGRPGLNSKISFELSVHITRPRLGQWKQHKSVSIPVEYHPRTRPFLPISPGLHPFFSTVKSAPGEWYQVNSTMGSREESVIPIDCHLFIPSVQIYAIRDTIPVHLQLRGPLSSLRSFIHHAPLPPVSKLGLSRRTSRASSTISSSSTLESSTTSSWKFGPSTLFSSLPRGSKAHTESSDPVVRVYILRQITAQVNGQKAWRSMVLGEGSLRPLQQTSLDRESLSEHSLQSLDWEGEVRCNDDVTTGSFVSGDLMVKDFMVLQLRPSGFSTSPFTEHKHAHSIRLVTDSYRDLNDYTTLLNL